jgi:hypothetical protein
MVILSQINDIYFEKNLVAIPLTLDDGLRQKKSKKYWQTNVRMISFTYEWL